MSDECCQAFGGIISVTIDGERYAPTEADIVIEPTNISREAKANQDGSMCVTSKPKLYGAEIKFRNDCGITWDENLRKCRVDVTIAEEDNGRTHIFTAAAIVGDVKVNLTTGEIDGLQIRSSRYQKLNS